MTTSNYPFHFIDFPQLPPPDPDDHITYIEDDHFVVAPRDAYGHWSPDHPDHQSFMADLNTRRAHNAQRYAKPAEKVDWQKDGF